LNNDSQILLTAIFQSARTTLDGGWRISFDVDSSQGELIANLVKQKDKQLFLVVSARKDETDSFNVDIKFDV